MDGMKEQELTPDQQAEIAEQQRRWLETTAGSLKDGEFEAISRKLMAMRQELVECSQYLWRTGVTRDKDCMRHFAQNPAMAFKCVEFAAIVLLSMRAAEMREGEE